MYNSVAEAVGEWRYEARLTQMVMDALTDQSLAQQIPMEGRTLGQLAWHMVTYATTFLAHFGLQLEQLDEKSQVPSTAQEIARRWSEVNESAARAMEEQLTVESLRRVQNTFGREMETGAILALLLKHHAHHRGQVTVLMRMAGLVPPGLYGPTKEGWRQMGQEPRI